MLFNSENILISPDLHDSHVMNFSVNFADLSRSMYLVVKTEQGLKYNLKFEKIVNLSFQNVYTQNTIADVFVWNNKEAIDKLDNYFSKFGFISYEELLKSLDFYNHSSWTLAHIMSSVGAEIICLSELLLISKSDEKI